MVFMMVAMAVSEGLTDIQTNFMSFGSDRIEDCNVFQEGFNAGK